MPNGVMLINGAQVRGSAAEFSAVNPTTAEALQPAFGGADNHAIELACNAAAEAFPSYRDLAPGRRAEFLDCIAEELQNDGVVITTRAALETGLTTPRLNNELTRTCTQLQMFARVLREGYHLDVRVTKSNYPVSEDAGIDIRQMRLPLGPVVVFGASNFPLAFSVAGGDTASALAAGCPVIVKGHPVHPGTSELVARAIVRAVNRCALSPGIFSLLLGQGHQLGSDLVRHSSIKAVGFTGSRSGGLSLMKAATYRPEPIPVYAEMSSINPVLLFPAAISNRPEQIAHDFISALTLGAGQFCTNPGLIIGITSEGLSRFEAAAITAISSSQSQTMLSTGIHDAYQQGISRLSKHKHTQLLAEGPEANAGNQDFHCSGVAKLFATDAESYLNNASLADEVFGASALIVRCHSVQQMLDIINSLEGQLTATLQADDSDLDLARETLKLLQSKVGRILYNGFPTGVEVCDAMVHGGPFPATSDGRSTSVGAAAIERFLRPVCFQNLPDGLLNPALKTSNPTGVPQRVNSYR